MTIVAELLAIAKRLLHPLFDAGGVHQAGLAGDLLAMAEQDHGRDPLDAEAAGKLLLLVSVDLGEPHPGLELARRLLELRRHHLAGPAPWCPEVDQQRDVALGGV